MTQTMTFEALALKDPPAGFGASARGAPRMPLSDLKFIMKKMISEALASRRPRTGFWASAEVVPECHFLI